MAGILNQNVFRLEVPVHDSQGMEVLQSAEDLGEVKSDHSGGENPFVLTVTEVIEVGTRAIRNPPGEKFGSLELAQDAGEKWMLIEGVWRRDLGQKLDFEPSAALGVVFGGFIDDFEGVGEASGGIGGFVVDEED